MEIFSAVVFASFTPLSLEFLHMTERDIAEYTNNQKHTFITKNHRFSV